ncbi:ATP-binding protein [Streptomyces sp. NPDC029554]|uniref:ATP-binding protein n=1 Tax=Streptomyces sp. NPDC029554 TaxID=3155126 RepID=UPI0033E592F9
MAKEPDTGRPLQYFPVDIGRYRHHAPLNTRAEVDGIADLLAPFGAETEIWDIDDELDKGADAVEQRLRTWSEPRIPANTFLYWVSHGESDGQSALLAHALSPRPLTAGGLTPETVVQYLAARQAHRHASGSWAIVVIDACRSARFVQLMSARAHNDSSGGPRNVLLVSTSGDGAANLGQFRRALSIALTVNFPAEDTIDLWTLAGELGRTLHDCPVIPLMPAPDAALRRKAPALAGALTVPLDSLAHFEAALATLTDDERRHVVRQVSGAELGEQFWYFEGRSDERHQILTWLNTARSGLLVVTGAAGSGKSALLGHVLIHSRPELSRLLERTGHLEPLPATTPRPEEPFDAVLHLTGADPQELVARIAAAAALGTPPTDPSLAVQTNWLYERMRRRRKSFTVLADALDEAQLPLVTARHILRRLASLPHVRVVVGTRRSTKDGPDLLERDNQDLLDALGAGPDGRAVVINVGREPAAVTRYVRRRLEEAAHYIGFMRALENVDRLASDIASRDREFLYARLAVHDIIQSDSLFGALDGLESLLASDHRQMFARTVDRLTALAPAYRPLLEALALAQGHGFPVREGLWASAATALTDDLTVSDADIAALTREAAPYLMLDTEFGQSVYRFAHRTFAEHFAPSSPEDHRHRLIAARLAADADDRLPAAPLNPYLVRYLALHASLAGSVAWMELARHPRVLERLSPTTAAAEWIPGGTENSSEVAVTVADATQLREQLHFGGHAPGPGRQRRRRTKMMLMVMALAAVMVTILLGLGYLYISYTSNNIDSYSIPGVSATCKWTIAEGKVISVEPADKGRLRATLHVERWYRPVNSGRTNLDFTYLIRGEADHHRRGARVLVVLGGPGEPLFTFWEGDKPRPSQAGDDGDSLGYDLEYGRDWIRERLSHLQCDTPTPVESPVS